MKRIFLCICISALALCPAITTPAEFDALSEYPHIIFSDKPRSFVLPDPAILSLAQRLTHINAAKKTGNRLPCQAQPAYVFTGAPGTGKSTNIRLLAQEIQARIVHYPYGHMLLDDATSNPRLSPTTLIESVLETVATAAQTSPGGIGLLWIEGFLAREATQKMAHLLTNLLPTMIAHYNAQNPDSSIYLAAETNTQIYTRDNPLFRTFTTSWSPTAERAHALIKHFTPISVQLSDAEMTTAASSLKQHTPAQLEAIVSLATLTACVDNEAEPQLTIARLRSAAKELYATDITEPSAHDAEPITSQEPTITFANIAGGIDPTIQELTANIKDIDTFALYGIKPPQGILLVGPPGTGKTLLARAIAGEIGAGFFVAAGSSFSSDKWIGTGGTNIRKLFTQAEEHVRTRGTPAIVFIDEIDAVGAKRVTPDTEGGGGGLEHNRVVTELLNQLDGFNQRNKIVVMASTNRKDTLDDALIRSGRFDTIIEIGLPDCAKRAAVFQLHMRTIAENIAKHAASLSAGPATYVTLCADINYEILARESDGLNCADIASIAHNAANIARRAAAGEINQAHLLAALAQKKTERAASASTTHETMYL